MIKKLAVLIILTAILLACSTFTQQAVTPPTSETPVVKRSPSPVILPATSSPQPTAFPPAAISEKIFPCAGNFESRELKKPYQSQGDAIRYTLSQKELDNLLLNLGIETLCIPMQLGSPFINVDWSPETNPSVNGRMISIGFENLYHGAGWSDGYILYSTYDFTAGTEYNTFANLDDLDAVQNGSMPDMLNVNGKMGFIRIQMSSLCTGSCPIYKTIIFPLEQHYLAVISHAADLNPEGEWLVQANALRSGDYPAERIEIVEQLDSLALSMHIK